MQARQKDQHILVTDNLPALLRTEKTSTIPHFGDDNCYLSTSRAMVQFTKWSNLCSLRLRT